MTSNGFAAPRRAGRANKIAQSYHDPRTADNAAYRGRNRPLSDPSRLRLNPKAAFGMKPHESRPSTRQRESCPTPILSASLKRRPPFLDTPR